MHLNDFLTYKTIYIQCHDNPDADALAAGFGLYVYFNSKGIDTHLIYSGPFHIQKSNLLLMIEKLEIPISYVESGSLTLTDELLITVDCQYGAGNVTKIPADHVAIIDHHQIEIDNIPDSLILSNYASCATVVWKLLLDAGMDPNENLHLSTALYYGLYTDSLQFAEVHNPADKDMRDTLKFSNSTISLLRNSNISANEFEIAGIAIIRAIHNETNRYSIIKSQPCDPNILGLISDMCIQVNTTDLCVVYTELPDGIKFSVRSCIKETKASDLAMYLAKGIGSGGGHIEKAGGFISWKKYKELCPDFHTEAFFSERIQEYCNSFDIIEAKTYDIDTSNMLSYRKKKLPVGYAIPTDILPLGTPITIRTLEGDIDTVISDDSYIMVGIQGEVYVNSKEKFAHSYRITEEPYHPDTVYSPTVKNRLTGKMIPLEKFMHSCIPTGDIYIKARPLTKAVKIFTQWDEEKYLLGNIGDYIAVRSDDAHDIYVIGASIFKKTYEEI